MPPSPERADSTLPSIAPPPTRPHESGVQPTERSRRESGFVAKQTTTPGVGPSPAAESSRPSYRPPSPPRATLPPKPAAAKPALAKVEPATRADATPRPAPAAPRSTAPAPRAASLPPPAPPAARADPPPAPPAGRADATPRSLPPPVPPPAARRDSAAEALPPPPPVPRAIDPQATVELSVDEIDYDAAYAVGPDTQIDLSEAGLRRRSIIPPKLAAVANDVRESLNPQGRAEAARELRLMKRAALRGTAGIFRRIANWLDDRA